MDSGDHDDGSTYILRLLPPGHCFMVHPRGCFISGQIIRIFSGRIAEGRT